MADEKMSLKAKARTTDFGSAGSRRLLRAGYIPAVIYGKQAPVHCAVNAKEFMMKMHTFTGSTLISLDVDGTEHRVFIKSFQENLLKGIVNHIDFYEVTAGVKVRAKVMIELVGTPNGIRNGGVLDQVLHEVDIECFPRDLPSVIQADVSALELNEGIRVSQLVVPETIKIHTPGDETVATVKPVKVEEAPAADDTADDASADSATAAPSANA